MAKIIDDEILLQREEIFNNSSLGILFFNKEGELIDANPAALKIIGVKSFDSIKGITIWENEDIKLRTNELDEKKIIRFKGALFPNFRPKTVVFIDWIVTKSNSGFLVQMKDITAEKQAGIDLKKSVNLEIKTQEELDRVIEQLRNAKEEYRVMAETVPYGVWKTDAKGKATYASPAFLELLDMVLSDLKESGWIHKLPPEDVEPVIRKWAEHAKSGEMMDTEHRIKGADKEYHTILERGLPVKDDKGNIISWVGVNLDITERKQIEEKLENALEKSEEEVKEVLLELAEANKGLELELIGHLKSKEEIKRNNLILSGINKIFQKGLNVESEEKLAQTALKVIEDIIGSSFGFICEITSERLLNTIAISFTGWEECRIPHSRRLIMATDLPIKGIRGRVIEDAKPIIFNDASSHPEWIEPPEGHTKIQSFLGVPLIYDGEVFGEIGLAHKDNNFSEDDLEAVQLMSFALVEALTSYRVRNKLRESVLELERSNRELQSFAYITSHDLQEPLRSIASYSQLIQRRYKGQLDEDADEFLDFMVAGATRMKEQIQGLLDYSRVGTRGEEFKEFSTENALNTALSDLNSSIEEFHAKITYDSLPSIFGDESQITRVFQNLIGNALKFSKKDVMPKIHISAKKEGNEYIFGVQDNGIGMEEQYIDKIFEVFKRLHAIGEYQGAGIGLAIVKRIIERHGGRIWVESDFGVGSTFYFTIPING